MYHYLFTNDLRISDLNNKMIEIAKLYLHDAVPTATEDKSTNNNATTLGYYFNLANCGACTQEAAKGNVRKVVINFIKKFQFPNPRTKESYENSREDGIKLAPLRSIMKLLFVSNMSDGKDGFLTKEEILDFVFFNDAVAKSDNVDYFTIYSQIKEHRDSDGVIIPPSIVQEDQRGWKHSERQVREMIKVLTWSGFVSQLDNGKLSLKISEDSHQNEKAELLDIVMEQQFFDYPGEDYSKCRAAYAEYLDEGVGTEFADEPIDVEANHNQRTENLQVILYGPPGTGKSYRATEIIKESYPNYGETNDQNPFVFRTTIYPDYSYHDFIGNVMPKVEKEKDNAITYDFIPGIFTLALSAAFKSPEKDIYLVVEEMSRGNVAGIFGDVFQLLDRDENGISEYLIKNELIGKLLDEVGVSECRNHNIYLPNNLHIIGTVNTSDQNVFVMDTAFKRRFEFEYIDLDPKMDPKTGQFLNNFSFSLGKYDINWIDFYQVLNKFIIKELELPEDKQIGQFFIKFNKDDTIVNDRQLYNKLLQYLWEDVQSVSIADVKLFKDGILSFSEAYKALKNHQNIFNEKLMKPFLKKTESNESTEEESAELAGDE